jgi:replication factor C subunit 3/5
MLWVDKYRPRTLDELDLHVELNESMRKIALSGDMPHLLLSGPSGGGKKTRTMAMLHEVYGKGVYNVKLEHKEVRVTDSKTIEVTLLSSPHHIDINPSDAGFYDRVIVMQMIREIAQTAPLVSAGMNAATGRTIPRFKVVVLNEVDKMSKGAQQALRRTMEKYMTTCRLILLCTSTSRLIPPLRSRCLGIRVPAHSVDNVKRAAHRISTSEHIPQPSDKFLAALSRRSEGNLRRALLMLEAASMAKCDLSGEGLDIPQADWVLYINDIVQDILTEQTPRRLHDIRLKMYELTSQCIPAEIIMRELVKGLMIALDPAMRRGMLESAAEFDYNLKLGMKPIVHLEAFVAAVMRLQKSGVTQSI